MGIENQLHVSNITNQKNLHLVFPCHGILAVRDFVRKFCVAAVIK